MAIRVDSPAADRRCSMLTGGHAGHSHVCAPLERDGARRPSRVLSKPVPSVRPAGASLRSLHLVRLNAGQTLTRPAPNRDARYAGFLLSARERTALHGPDHRLVVSFTARVNAGVRTGAMTVRLAWNLCSSPLYSTGRRGVNRSNDQFWLGFANGVVGARLGCGRSGRGGPRPYGQVGRGRDVSRPHGPVAALAGQARRAGAVRLYFATVP
jgi:hypothetical protein